MEGLRLNTKGNRLLRKAIAMLTIVLTVFGHFTAGIGFAQIVPDHRTATSVTIDGNVTDVTTGTVVGESGINSFDRFSVGSGGVVNLHLPSGTSNLVNLVHNDVTRIDGLLNSIKDGAVGGNVYFLNPHGVVVGENGVVNVGSLTLLTPTGAFLNQLVASNGNISSEALSNLYNGQVPLNRSGTITVQGGVNAVTDITMQAGEITNEGQMVSGAVYGGSAVDFSDVVNINGLEIGERISVQNGNIVIGAVTDFTNEGVIATNGATGLDAGKIEIQAGGTVTLAPGSELSADAPGHTSGDIRIVATQTDQGSGAAAKAATGIIVDGATIRGGNVTLQTFAMADHSWSVLDPDDIFRTVIPALQSFAAGVSVNAVQADARSVVTIKGGSLIDATGRITLSAESTATAGITGLASGQVASLGFAYGETIAHADVDIQSGSTLRGGSLDVSARNVATLDVSVYAVTTGEQADAAFAVTNADVVSNARIAQGATIDISGNVALSAVNLNSFSTSASSSALGQGVAGIAATLFTANTAATATTDSNLIGIDNLTIRAADLTQQNATKASGTAGSSAVVRTLMKPVNGAEGYLSNKLGTKSLDSRSGASETPKLAGAVTIVDSTQGATASIGNNVQVDATGAVAVISDVEAAGVQNHASSSVSSTAKDPNNPSATLTLSAAVAYGDYTHRATSFIGQNARISATNVGVRSDVAKPYEITWHKWEGISTITSKINGNLGVANGFLTGYASATGEATELGLNGAVSYLDFENSSQAYIGRGATINIRNGGSNGAWDTRVPGSDPSVVLARWQSPVDVQAHSEIAGVFGSGNIGITLNGAGGGGPGAVAAGGAYGQVNYTSDTRAFVADGASIQSVGGHAPVDVSITALSSEQVYLIAPSAGRGASFGLSGNFSLININSNTEASIDRTANVDARDVNLTASDDILSFAIAGAFNMADTASVGLGIAIQDVDATTRAFIGDNSANLPGTAITTPGVVRARSLGIEARTDGVIETISIAGTLVNNSDPNEPPGFLDKTKAKLTAGVDAIKGGVSKGTNYLKSLLGLVPEGGGQAAPPADPSPDEGGTGGYEPKFGLGISGSSSVNLANLTTDAFVDNAVVNLTSGAAETSRLNIGAVNGTHIGAFSGSAALMRAKAPSSNFSAAIAGAVALNDFDTVTRARVVGSVITGASDNSITALSGGEQLAIGLGAAVNASAKQDKAVSAAGSVSVNMARNEISAGAENSVLTGRAMTQGDVDIIAYNRIDLGTGGGALVGGGRGGFGAAVTYSEIRNVARAYLTGSQVRDFRDVRVEGLTGSLIGAGGAMAGFTTAQSSVTLGGAFVISEITNETSATIQDSTVEAAGDIGVVAQDIRGVGTLDDIIDANDCTGTCDGAHEQIFDFAGSEVRDPGSAINGSSIISVAGVVQGSRNNVGLSFTWNRIANNFSATVQDSSLTAGDKIDIQADSLATILGFSVGVGVGDKFAGGGSVTLNVIDNETLAQIVSTSGGHAINGRVLNVNARDGSAIGSTSGQVNAAMGKASLGVTFAHNQITNTTRSLIDGIDVTTTGAVGVTARNTSSLLTASISGSVSQGVAIGGSAASAHIMNTTDASVISSGSRSLNVGSLTIDAQDQSSIISAAGQVSAAVGGNVAVGGAAVVNRIENTTKSLLQGMNVQATSGVNVTSSNRSLIGTGAASGGGSTSVAVNGSAAFSQIWNTTTSNVVSTNNNTLNAGSLTVRAIDASEIDALSGQVSVSTGAAAVGGAATYNEIGNQTRANVLGMRTLTSGVAQVEAKNSSVIRTLSASGGVASQAAVTLSLSVSVIGNTTDAEMSGGQVDSGSVNVQAADESEIDSLAGQLSGSGTAAAGGAVSHSQIINATRARLHDINVGAASSIGVLANNASIIRTASAAAGIAGKAAVEGSITSAIVANVTEASAQTTTLRSLSGSALNVKAEDASEIDSFGGQLAGAAMAAVGGAVVNSVITNQTRANVSGYDLDISGASTIAATNQSIIRTAAVSGGFSGKAAVEGSIASAHIQNTTEADLYRGQSTNTSNAISVLASDQGSISTLSGAAAIAGVAGVGAAASVNRIANTTRARVHGVAAGGTYDLADLLVKAESATKIENVSVGVGGSVKVGVAGSTAVNLINNTTEGFIDGGAKVLARNNVGVLAESHDLITNAAGAAGIGVAAAGVSGSVSVNQIGGSTRAFISGADTEVTALAQDANRRISVAQGELQSVDLGSLIDLEALDPTSDWRPQLRQLQRREDVRGVAVNATSTHSIQYMSANLAGGLYAGVAGTIATSVITGSTHAYVDRAAINSVGMSSSVQGLTVKASDHAYSHGIVGTVGIGAGGVGLASNTNVFVRDTKAYLSNSSAIGAAGAITVDASSSQGVTTVGAGAGGGAVGVAGIANVAVFANQTAAYAENVELASRDLSVTSGQLSRMFVAAGTVTVGAGAFGGALSTAINVGSSRALINNSQVAATGNVVVDAQSETEIDNWAVGASGGMVAGVAGNAVVSVMANTTEALVTATNIGTASQRANAVAVKAHDLATVRHRAGALGLSITGAGVGASASVTVVQNTTVARIDDGAVYTTQDVSVNALAERDLNTWAISGGIGAGVGLGGVAAVTVVGTRVDGDILSDLNKDGNGTLAAVDGFANGDSLEVSETEGQGNIELVGGLTRDDVNSVNSASRYTASDKVTGTIPSGTVATIGTNTQINAGRDVRVVADERVSASMVTGAGAGSIGASIGGSVGVVNVAANVAAQIHGSASVFAQDNLTVAAGVGSASGSGLTVDVQSYQGSAGIVSLGAAISDARIANNVTASVGAGALLNVADGTLFVNATDTTSVNSHAEGYTAGLAAAGVVVATADKSGSTVAVIGDTSSTTGTTRVGVPAGELVITGSRSGRVEAFSRAGAGGILGTGVGSGATANDTGSTRAGLMGNVIVTGHADITIGATATPETIANAMGYGGSLYHAVGAAVATAAADPTVEALIGAGGSVQGKSLTVRGVVNLAANRPSAKSFAEAVGIGLVGFAANAAVSTANTGASVLTSVGSVLQIAEDAEIFAGNTTAQQANVSGVTGGMVAVGANVATASNNSTTLATLAGNVSGTIGGRLSVKAAGRDEQYAGAVSGSGGIVAGAAATATTNSTSNTRAKIGSTAAGFMAGAVNLDAAHTTTFNGRVDSVNAAAVGMSGAIARHTVSSIVDAELLNGTRLTTRELNVAASNISNKPGLSGGGFNAVAGAGGIFNGTAVSSSSDLSHETRTTIGPNTVINVIGDRDNPGHASFSAINDFNLTDKTRLDAGGAIEIAAAGSHIRVNKADAQVTVGRGVVMDSVGNVNFGVRTSATIHTSANAKTYGLAGAAQGSSTSYISTANTIGIANNVQVRTDGDINIHVGRDLTGNTNRISAVARTDLYNKTALPVETSPRADAEIRQDNSIGIGTGAALRSVGDIQLLALKGSINADGRGTGKDLYREIAEAVANAFSKLIGKGDVSLSLTGGSSKNNSSSFVNVDGLVHAGIQNKQRLVIDAYGNITEQTEGVRVAQSNENVGVNLHQRLESLQNLRTAYWEDETARAAYTAEINMIIRELRDLGYTAVDEDTNPTDYIIPDLNVVYITVEDVKARGGDVSVIADHLGGQGSLRAPNDSEITIENHSDKYLRVNRLTIEERGGHVFFNGAAVTSSADINARNIGGRPAAALHIEAAGSSDVTPTITVRNTYNPSLMGGGRPVPDIEIVGDITNRTGTANITNEQGSIKIQGIGSQPAPSIIANTVNMQAGRSIVQSYVDGFEHIGGDPKSHWNGVTSDRNEVRNGVGGRIAGNNIFIAARYLNINGTIQSGIPDWELGLDATTLEATISAYRTLWAQLGRPKIATAADLNYYRLWGAAGNIAAYYNPETNQIILDGVKVEGGYAELFGEIMNTGGGRIRVMDGYGRITVNSNLGYDLVINGLDTGNNIAGVVRITDSRRTHGGSPITTVYERENGVVKQSEWVGDSFLRTVSNTAGRSGTYNPTSGLRYVWQTGRDFMSTWVGERSSTAFWGIPAGTGGYDSFNRTATGSERPLPNGEFTIIQHGNPIFDWTTREYSTGPLTFSGRKEWSECNFHLIWCHSRTYYVRDTWKQGSMEVYTRALKADHPIPVEFIGYDAGQSFISVSHGGNIELAASVLGRGGSVSISADGSITQTADNARVVGRSIAFQTGGALGSALAPVQVEISGTGALAARAADDIHLTSAAGDLRIDEAVSTAGNVSIQADGSILQATSGDHVVVQGERIELASQSGSIGTAAQALNIRAGAGGERSGLNASAAQDISIRQVDGDLRLFRVESFGGDVTLEVMRGTLIDANTEEERDERTIEQLEQLWDEMQLLGEGAEQSAEATLAAYARNKEAEYHRYWAIRGVQPQYDENGMVVGYIVSPHDPGHTHPEYASLHEVYGDTSYSPTWTYQVTEAERAALTEGSEWTRDELMNSLSRSILFKQTGSTETAIRQPNIVGHNVTLLSRQGSVGTDSGSIVIDGNDPDALKSEAARLALAAAEADDIGVDNLTNQITVLQRRAVNVAASGDLTVEARDHAYIGSRQPIYVQTVAAGDSIRIKGTQGLYSVSTTGPANVTGGRTILEGGTAGIGTVENPLRIGLSPGAGLTARGEGDIYIQQLIGDLSVAEIFSLGNVSLTAQGSILDVREDRPIAIQGEAINLVAETGSIGTDDNPLAVTVAPSGLLNASGNGIYVTAGGVASLGSIVSGGALHVSSNADLIVKRAISAGSEIRLTSLGNMELRDSVTTLSDVYLVSGGSISQSGSGRILDAAYLSTQSVSGQTLLGTNTVSRISLVNTHGGDVEFAGAVGSLVIDTVAQPLGDVSIENTGHLILVGNLTSEGVVTLTAGGRIEQMDETKRVAVAHLVTRSVGGQSFVGPNAIRRLDAQNMGGRIEVASAVNGLEIAAINQLHGGDISLTNTGNLVMTGTVSTTDQVTIGAAGTITQTGAGRVAAGLLSTSSQGGQALTGANQVATFTARNSGAGVIQFVGSTAPGPFAMASSPVLTLLDVIQLDGGDISISHDGAIGMHGQISTTGNVSLAAAGTLTQGGAGRITEATQLITQSVGGQSLLGANTVRSFTAVNAGAGSIDLGNTSGSLELASIDQVDGGAINVSQQGAIVVTDRIRTDDTVAVVASGSIAQVGDGRIEDASYVSMESAGGLSLTGDNTMASLGATNTGGSIDVVNTFDGFAARNITQTAGGNIHLVNVGHMVLTGDVRTTDEVTLTAAGAITQTGLGRITAAQSLKASSVGGQILTGVNSVARFESQNTGGAIELNNAHATLELSEIIQLDGGDIRIVNAGHVEMAGNVETRAAVSIDALGTIQQTGAGRVTAASSLTTSSIGGQTLTGLNTVGAFSGVNTDAGTIIFTNERNDLRLGSIIQTDGDDVIVGNVGTITMSGEIRTVDRVGVVATESMSQVADGRVTGAELLVTQSRGGQALLGNNTVANFAAVNEDGGAIRLANTYDGLQIATVDQVDGGDIHLSNVGHMVLIDQLQTTDVVTLISTATMGQLGDGRVSNASMLVTQSAGGQTLLGDNTVESFMAQNTAGGTIDLRNRRTSLELAGIVQAEGGDVQVANDGHVVMTGAIRTSDSVSLAAEGTIEQQGNGRISATLLATDSFGGQSLGGANRVARIIAANARGGALTLENAYNGFVIESLQQIDGGDVVVDNDGDMIVAGAVRTAGNVTLRAEGTLVQTGAGRVSDAAVLNTVSTGGQMLEGDNTVARFNAINQGGDIRFANTAGALVIGNVEQAADGDVYINNQGDIHVEKVASTQGTTHIHATGSILNGNLATQFDRSSIDAVSINLTADTGSIGSSTAYLYIDSSNASSGVVTASAAQGIYLWEVDGDLKIGRLKTAGDIDMVADGSILNRGTVNAIMTATNMNLRSLNGQIGEADARVTLVAPGTVNAWALGSVYLGVPAGDLISDEMESMEGRIDLLVPTGAVKLGKVTAHLGLALQAPVIHLNELIHTGDDPMRVTLHGIDGMADEIVVNGYSEAGMIFDLLEADVARINVQTDRLAFLDTLIGTRAEFRNNYYLAVAENVEKRLIPSHLQLYPRDLPFYLIFNADREMLTDAMTVNYDDDFIINRFHTENSIVRITSKLPDIVGATEEPTYAPGVRIPDAWWLTPDDSDDEDLSDEELDNVLKLVDTQADESGDEQVA